MQPWEFDVSQLAAAYRARDLTPSEMVTATLERIDTLDGVVGAFRSVLADKAIAAAAESDRRVTADPRPLEGVPVAIKELFDVAGADGTYGSALRAGQVHAADAEAVRRLRQAGAIVVGTTRSHEFGWGITTQHATLGSTANPWDTNRVPGGSSGGSAAALATGMVPLALGSDTGGSIRIPAAFCGVVGLKPTYGRIPKIGAVSLAPSLDHPGPMARTVADAALALEVLAGPHPDDPSSRRHPMAAPKTRPLVGVCFDLHLVDPAPDHAAAFESTVAALSGAGFDVVEVRFPMAADIRPAFATIQMAEAHHVHNRVLATFPDRADEYGADVRSRLEAAAEVGLADYLEARAMAAAVTAAFAELFAERCDVLLTPVSAGPPAHRADPDTVTHLGTPLALRDLVMGFTVPQDLAGLPAVAVPVGFDDAGLPVGVQFTAWHDEERTATAVAAAVSRDLGWPQVAQGGSST